MSCCNGNNSNKVSDKTLYQQKPAKEPNIDGKVKLTNYTTKEILHGIIGITKSRLHINRSSDEIIKKRTEICLPCKFNNKNKKNELGFCNHCGCILKDKINNKDENCPLGFW